MSATAKKVTQELIVPTAIDFRLRVKEAAIAVESALVTAEMLATHGVIESMNYERLIDLLQEAGKAVDEIDAGLPATPLTIFPSRTMAEAFIAKHPIDDDHRYDIRPDGIGRCTVAVFRLIAHL